jgi:hypothetical protein
MLASVHEMPELLSNKKDTQSICGCIHFIRHRIRVQEVQQNLENLFLISETQL